ncbi:MAG: HRDC domain-containing protein [Geobacteraceae bacterium]|nr:HRDC domain-containing protein [Geobacteraceae bacterium]
MSRGTHLHRYSGTDGCGAAGAGGVDCINRFSVFASHLCAPLADPDICKIFHAADYDIRCLARDFDIQINGLFDTMIASQLLGEPKVGLGDVLHKYFGVELDKQYQRADWSKRPISAEMLHYAAEDTHYLEDLMAILRRNLEEKDRLWWAEEEFRLLEQVRFAPPQGPACLQVKGAAALNPRQLEALEHLINWRDAKAYKRDCPGYKIMSNKALLALATAMPRSEAQLDKVEAVPAKLRQRHAGGILESVATALERAQEELPVAPQRRRREVDPVAEERFKRLKQWRSRKAQELELDPGILVNNSILSQIAYLLPSSCAELEQIEGMRHWQRQLLGPELVAELRN